MDAASLLTGLFLGALLATAATLGVVTLLARNRPDDTGLEPVHESLAHLHRLLAGIERDRATAHGELREQMGAVGQTSAQLQHETAALVELIKDVRETGVSIVWIEHVVHALIAAVDRLVVLHGGALIAEGNPAEVIGRPQVAEIYMGIERQEAAAHV